MKTVFFLPYSLLSLYIGVIWTSNIAVFQQMIEMCRMFLSISTTGMRSVTDMTYSSMSFNLADNTKFCMITTLSTFFEVLNMPTVVCMFVEVKAFKRV